MSSYELLLTDFIIYIHIDMIRILLKGRLSNRTYLGSVMF